MIPTVIVHCKPLGRSLDHMLAHIPEAFVFDAPVAPNHEGCIAGHQHAVNLARENGWDAVGVLEDDCEFTKAFDSERWMLDVEWARRHGYNVVNGGCFRTARPRKVRDGLYAVTHFKSAHCVVYLPSAFEVVDRLVYPMDVMIGRLGAKPVVTVPFVAIQGKFWSGHLHEMSDYHEDYAQQEARLMGIS